MQPDELFVELYIDFVNFLVAGFVHRQVVAHTTANKRFFHLWQGIDSMIDVEQLCMAGVEVAARLGKQARRARTTLATLKVSPMHAIHVGTWPPQVANVALEIFHLHHLFHFAHNRLFTSRGNELALMGTDGAKGTPPKAPTVHVDRVPNHLIGRNALVFVARVGQASIGQVKRGINFLCGHGRVGAIHLDGYVARCLPQVVAVPQVRLHFHCFEVLGLQLGIGKACLIGV